VTSSSRHRVTFSYSALIIHFPTCLQCTVKVCIQRIINANVNEQKPHKRREQCKGTRMKAATGFSSELYLVRGDSYALTFMQLSLMFLPSGMDSPLRSFHRCVHYQTVLDKSKVSQELFSYTRNSTFPLLSVLFFLSRRIFRGDNHESRWPRLFPQTRPEFAGK